MKKFFLENCIIKKCIFPSTCRWNNMCMQKGLQESLNAKKTFSIKRKFNKAQKIDPLKPRG